MSTFLLIVSVISLFVAIFGLSYLAWRHSWANDGFGEWLWKRMIGRRDG
jgi:hypothetical protein